MSVPWPALEVEAVAAMLEDYAVPVDLLPAEVERAVLPVLPAL